MKKLGPREESVAAVVRIRGFSGQRGTNRARDPIKTYPFHRSEASSALDMVQKGDFKIMPFLLLLPDRLMD